jgi:hypothetical protein
MPSSIRALLLVAILAFPSACGPTAATPNAGARSSTAATTWITGRVRYEARAATPRGASRSVTLRPSRHVLVESLDASGAVVGRSVTGPAGQFELETTEFVRVRVSGRVDHEGHALVISTSREGTPAHYFDFPATSAHEPLDLVLPDVDPHGVGGAFHALDTALRGVEAVREWTGAVLPELVLHWERGGPNRWSTYEGEFPKGSGRRLIRLLGGEPGNREHSDGDEHDEHVILHELGHFAFDVLTTDSTPGGSHPGGHLVEPGLAWEEGRATWFAAAVLGAPRYLDTVGVEPFGRLVVDADLERTASGPKGLGSQESVAEILWDLADGAGGLPDLDGDPVALGPDVLLREMIALSEVGGAYPSLSTFLAHLVDRKHVEGKPLYALLLAGGHDPELPRSSWPHDIRPGERVAGKIDSMNDPELGGPALKSTGIDAVRVFRFRLDRPAFVEARLKIFGSGHPDSGEDLDLELRDIRAKLITRSNGTGSEESVARFLGPGWYVVYVRDAGRGANAAFELTVRAE